MILFGKPKEPEDVIYQAMSFLEKNQPKAAIVLFNQALKADPKNIEALYNKGLALNQIRKYQDAITSFDKVLEIKPDDAPSLNNQAIEIFDKLLTEHKNNVNVIYAKSRSKAALGEIDQSLDLLKQAISQNPKVIKKWAKQETVFEKIQDDERFKKITGH